MDTLEVTFEIHGIRCECGARAKGGQILLEEFAAFHRSKLHKLSFLAEITAPKEYKGHLVELGFESDNPLDRRK